MGKILNLFRLRNIILLFAIGLIPFTIKNFTEASVNFNELMPHKGIVEDKSIHTEESQNHNSITTVKIKLLNNESIYSISFQAQGVYNVIYIGDSVELYSKKVKDKKGNEVSGGGTYWYSTDSNQIFHIVSNRYKEPVVDFKKYHKDLKMNAWMPLALLIICFIWYFILRRRNAKPNATITFQ
jgi:hypothetical protein